MKIIIKILEFCWFINNVQECGNVCFPAKWSPDIVFDPLSTRYFGIFFIFPQLHFCKISHLEGLEILKDNEFLCQKIVSKKKYPNILQM